MYPARVHIHVKKLTASYVIILEEFDNGDVRRVDENSVEIVSDKNGENEDQVYHKKCLPEEETQVLFSGHPRRNHLVVLPLFFRQWEKNQFCW